MIRVRKLHLWRRLIVIPANGENVHKKRGWKGNKISEETLSWILYLYDYFPFNYDKQIQYFYRYELRNGSIAKDVKKNSRL